MRVRSYKYLGELAPFAVACCRSKRPQTQAQACWMTKARQFCRCVPLRRACWGPVCITVPPALAMKTCML